jgi:hypothetical protein
MGSLAGLLGLDAADRLGGGPADGADVVAGQVDREGVGGSPAAAGIGLAPDGARARTAGSRSGSNSCPARAAAVLNRSAGTAMPRA